ncbi:enoyl-CoA hydratase [Alphaproteobacteria bacterium]|nr:enoyl-CoA hydratase [Alphaproteobacteria bacterium]
MNTENNSILNIHLNPEGILRIVLNNPKSHNTLSEKMISSLQQSLDDAASDEKVRVVIIAAEGSTFSAGHDLKEMKAGRLDPDKGKSYFSKIMLQCSTLMQSIVTNPKPIIAEVNGTATAAGCQLVASCDLAYASVSARFATPGVNIGLFCSTPMVALSRSVANKHSMEMLLTGEFISSHKAAQIGLINENVKDESLQKHVLEKAIIISKKSKMTLKTGKKAFYKQLELTLSQAYEFASDVMVNNMLKLDAEEGIDAFLEKRKPSWQDK